MQTTRRDFFKFLGGSFLASSALAQSLDEEIFGSYFTGHIPVSQHMTNETSAQFSVLTKGSMPYAYRAYDWQGRELAVEMWDHEKRKDFLWGIDKLIVRDLKSGGKYRLQVIDKDRGTILDERFFKNLLLNRTSLRFAIVSCSCDIYHFQNRNMWNHLFDNRPEMIFYVGDACYADLGADGSEFDLWRRYSETRRTLNHFRKSNLIPTLAAWDDHDYGKNNANKHYKNKKMAQRCFQTYFGSMNVSGFINTVGIGSVFSGFGQRFFFMDDRSFRDKPGTKNGMMWGGEQQERFFDFIAKNENPSWIFNGSQFFSNYPGEESFQKDYFKNLTDVTRKLAKTSAPVVFGSGDTHFSEVMKIEPRVLGYKTYEFTSSAIHSFNPPTPWLKNPRREVHTWKHNFMIMNSSTIKGGLKTSCYTTGRFGNNLFYHDGTILR